MKTYTLIAKFFHWGMAVAIFGLMALGLFMTEMPLSPEKLLYYSWHKWVGVSIFILVWLRLVWRAFNPPPAYPPSISLIQQRMANAMHIAVYALMALIPLSGWLLSSAKGFQTVWFGVFPLPDLINKDKVLGDMLHDIHENLNYLLILFLGGHVSAALKHHMIDKDEILNRMLPFGSISKKN